MLSYAGGINFIWRRTQLASSGENQNANHGDNMGARGLWGKSTMYGESVAMPLILAGRGMPSIVAKGGFGATPPPGYKPDYFGPA